ncbi:MAG: hypothetical protein KC503_27535 [Myxococcales bacterium]|nr:hypothetical protein [Myxococcales bacterium]
MSGRTSSHALARVASFALVLLALVAAAGVARAASRAERLLARGIKQYRAARFRRSLRTCRQAERRAGDDTAVKAKAALYVGLNYGVLGKAAKAKRAFERALKLDASLELDRERFKPSDVRRLARVRQGLLGKVVVSANGGDIYVDGARRGASPQTLSLPVGRHVFETRQGSRRSGKRELLVRYDANHSVSLVLPAAPKPQKPLPAATPKVDQDNAALSNTPSRDDADTGGASPWSFSHKRLWTWITGGLAVASAGAAIGVGVSAKADEDEYLNTQDPSRLQPLRDAVKTKTTVTNVLVGVAGGLAITSLLLYYFEGRSAARKGAKRDGDRDDTSVSVDIGPGGATLHVKF